MAVDTALVPYQRYKIEGPEYYNFFKTELSNTVLNAFYTTKLTAAGWTAGKLATYLNGKRPPLD